MGVSFPELCLPWVAFTMPTGSTTATETIPKSITTHRESQTLAVTEQIHDDDNKNYYAPRRAVVITSSKCRDCVTSDEITDHEN